jgi:hypothetical protein
MSADTSIDQRYFQFLDSLKRLGITNIKYAVAAHLMLKFNLTREQAAEVLGAWARQEVAHG